jgi:hypothetical protein
MSWFIDVYTTAGVKIGSGPITSATMWESTSRMDRAGVFSFALPAADDKSTLLQALRVVRCSAQVDGSYQVIGSGVIESITTSIGDDGRIMLAVSGVDLLGELSWRTTNRYYLDGSVELASTPMTPVTHAAAVAFLENIVYTTGWRFTPDDASPVNSLVGRWNYETVLQAMISLAAKCRTHFYVSGDRRVTFASTSVSSGMRAVRALSTPTAGVCAITQLEQIEDAGEIVTTLIPFGGGNADARLTMKAMTRTLPAGFQSPTSGLWHRILRNLTAEGLYGVRIKAVQWNDITPISSTDADVEAAANALFDQALRYMLAHDAPAKFYSLAVAGCQTVLRPMQTIRVVYRDLAQHVDIDADLLILEATTTATADGPQTTRLTVATVDRYPESDVGAMVGRLRSGQMYEAAPQLNANSYVISYNKPIDDVETAIFRFRFDSEVTQLTRVTFDFQLLPLESTVKSVAGTSQTTAAGGATTTAAGGSTTSSSGGATTTAAGGATTSSGGSSHSHTVSNHTHDVPNHQHRIGASQGSGGRNVGLFTGGGMYYEGADVGVVSIYTTSDSGSVTAASGGGQTSSSEGSHTHTIGDHTHTIGSHTHTIGDHTHTIGSHTHDFTPTLTASYGIFRDSGANMFGLTDVEYSVDGSTWYAFTVGVNGFASLGDGWYRVDLTSLLQNSTTLRPTSNNNAVGVRRKSTGAIKRAMIEAQLNIRTIIQAIAAL